MSPYLKILRLGNGTIFDDDDDCDDDNDDTSDGQCNYVLNDSLHPELVR
jgi:hypothetical protein